MRARACDFCVVGDGRPFCVVGDGRRARGSGGGGGEGTCVAQHEEVLVCALRHLKGQVTL